MDNGKGAMDKRQFTISNLGVGLGMGSLDVKPGAQEAGSELDALQPESVAVPASAEGRREESEKDWGVALRVRRKACRMLGRSFWWGALSTAACWSVLSMGNHWDSGIFFDYDEEVVGILSGLGFYGICGVTAIVGAFANSSKFVYKNWEAAGFAIANLIFYLGFVLGVFLWIN